MSIATISFLVFIGLSVATAIIMNISLDDHWDKMRRLYDEELRLRS